MRRLNISFILLTVLSVTSYSQNGPRSLPAVKSQAEFDSISVTYDANTPYALPHALFVIDRKDNNKIYYVNNKRYSFHKDFVNGTYLSLESGKDFFDNNYLKPNRRFILGTIAYQTPVKRWTYEFWEGDLIPSDQIQLAGEIINKTFFIPVAFKPNSLRQDEASQSLTGVERILQSDIAKEQAYQALNIAKGIGRIHIIDKLDEHVEIGFNEILVLDEVPVQLPPVAGIITSKPSTPLSHINLLAKGWGIPNAYIKNAKELFKQYDTWWVTFETNRDNYSVKRADLNQLHEYQRRLKERLDVVKPRFDLSETRLLSLAQQRKTLSVAFGGKSANLGEVMHASLPGIIVPGGFTIPFYYYDEFIKRNNLDDEIFALLNDQKFVHDPAYRRRRLETLREHIQKAEFDPELKKEVLARVAHEFPGKGLFVRSSSNSEDLPNFSGAGLYTTVPNVRGDNEVIEAIKTVWASLWNFEAYEFRERANVDHSKIFMAVLLQEGINSESSGVMISTDPFDKENVGAIYISAKRGLGIKVVEGQRIAEQIIFRPRTNAVQVLTRSAEDSLLTFDENGGVKEVPITGDRVVLTDDVIRRLVRAATEIKRVFGSRDQDIEWAYMKGQIFIVQSRAYIPGG
ncbi:MAG TPA: PEP/pyruvate-binding domain-containing protein [Pyrinomonadaceae bacterium]|jgi:Phosphoenolpyruvate synthase/pyruvate phosphate dikinase|nr:PEP/pyruvate-binding domain-containing protein [Pyrinomonadaceae bacterium]